MDFVISWLGRTQWSGAARRWAQRASGVLIVALAAGVWAAATAPRAVAGGGPENLFLLVNANSESSKTIANHYIELRKIPASNVFYVGWKGSFDICLGKNFREVILLPALQAIESRRLNAQIDYLVYSSDFPWRMDLQSICPDDKFTLPFDGNASLTGVSYLAPLVASQNPAIVMPSVNWYVPGSNEQNQWNCQQLDGVPSRGFRSRYLWDSQGKHTTLGAAGQRYLLSTILGITQGRGNTVEEVLSYLRRAATADGTRPRGTVYFVWNKDVRSTTRDKCFAGVAAEINRAGVRASVVRGRLPNSARDVMGLMTGTPEFDLPGSGSVILPGAICENLTSSGGYLKANGAQTPLSVFLRFGAAGASGTIAEPRAIQAKFPLPSLQLHYVRGCSLAESFYQSVSGPYQLLIVGDPLCQPWAVFPNIALEGIQSTGKVSGTLSLTPSGTATGGHRIGVYELFIDGRLVARNRPGETLTLDTKKLADGYHELRIVGVHADAIETQGRRVVPITVDNHGAAVEMRVAPLPGVSHNGKLRVSVRQPGATAIVIRQNSREVARVQGEAGEVEIPAVLLGRGPTVLQAFGAGGAAAVSAPVRIQVN